MALHNPKRRKLHHDGGDLPDRHGELLDGEEEVTSSNIGHGASSMASSMQKGFNASAKQATEADSSAMYAGDLFKSSMFKLQLDEMLLEVRPNYAKLLEPIDNALRKLKTLIEDIEDREPLTVSQVIF